MSGAEAGERTPAHGARFVLERLEGEAERATYGVRVELRGGPTGAPRTLSAIATVTPAEVELGAWNETPEPWAIEVVLGLCRTLGKHHAPTGDWPRVVRRWRAPRH